MSGGKPSELTHLDAQGRNLMDAVIERARRDGRMVLDEAPVVALCPWAPMAPFEVWFVPIDGGAWLGDAPDALVDALADRMARVEAAVMHEVGDPARNTLLYTAPFDEQAARGSVLERLRRRRDGGIEAREALVQQRGHARALVLLVVAGAAVPGLVAQEHAR